MQIHDIKALSHEHPVLAYDGVCILCNGYVKWLIKRDKREVFRYIALQNADAVRASLPLDDNDTVVLYDKGKRYTHSDVGLMITKHLGGLWPILSYLNLLPKSWRDLVYRWIAKNRYRWFGKAEVCILPDLAKRHLFLGL